MGRDRLFLLAAPFHDPLYPGRSFFCWHCALLEGILASVPIVPMLDVERVAWPRPRLPVIELLGESNQSLPVLVLAGDAPDGLETGRYQSNRFVEGKDAILRVLAGRHGFPHPHP